MQRVTASATKSPLPAALPARSSPAPVRGDFLQRKARNPEIRAGSDSFVPPIVHEVLRSPGQPLDAATREFMEPRFGHDFSKVRVHTGPLAAESARAVQATAYAMGRNLVFNAGQYSPNVQAGRSLLAHELAHVVQQTGNGSEPNCAHEAEADAAASAVAKGTMAHVRTTSQVGIARQPAPGGENDEDIYKLFEEMPQLEKDEIMSRGSRMRGFSAPDEKPKETKPAADVGCHTSPYKASAEPAVCAPHHKQPDEATRMVAKHLNDPAENRSLEMAERAARDKLDRLNMAYLHFQNTRKYIHRDEFSPYEIEKDNLISTSQRWDLCMGTAQANNLEEAKYDEHYFRSLKEYVQEGHRRYLEYRQRVKDCGQSRPSHYVCREKVMSEYFPERDRMYEASAVWAYNDKEIAMPVLEESGPIAGAGFNLAHEAFGWNTERSAAFGGFVSNVSNAAGLKAVKSSMGSGGGQSSGPGDPPVAAIHGDAPEVVNQAETQPDRPAGQAAPSFARSGPLDKTQPEWAFDNTAPELVYERNALQMDFEKAEPATIAAPPTIPMTAAPKTAGAGYVSFAGTEAATPAQVRAAYKANPFTVKKSLGDLWHQMKWEENGGQGTAPIAFRTADGTIRVNEVRWLAVGELSEINTAADLAPSPMRNGGGKKPAVDPLAETGEAVKGKAKAAPPAPIVKPGQQTQLSSPALPAVRGYTPVPESVVIEAYRINQYVISPSYSSDFHQTVWIQGGGKGKAPLAYRVGDLIRVDVASWPIMTRAQIGQ